MPRCPSARPRRTSTMPSAAPRRSATIAPARCSSWPRPGWPGRSRSPRSAAARSRSRTESGDRGLARRWRSPRRRPRLRHRRRRASASASGVRGPVAHPPRPPRYPPSSSPGPRSRASCRFRTHTATWRRSSPRRPAGRGRRRLRACPPRVSHGDLDVRGRPDLGARPRQPPVRCRPLHAVPAGRADRRGRHGRRPGRRGTVPRGRDATRGGVPLRRRPALDALRRRRQLPAGDDGGHRSDPAGLRGGGQHARGHRRPRERLDVPRRPRLGPDHRRGRRVRRRRDGRRSPTGAGAAA